MVQAFFSILDPLYASFKCAYLVLMGLPDWKLRFLRANFGGRCIFEDIKTFVKDADKKSHKEMKMETWQESLHFCLLLTTHQNFLWHWQVCGQFSQPKQRSIQLSVWHTSASVLANHLKMSAKQWVVKVLLVCSFHWCSASLKHFLCQTRLNWWRPTLSCQLPSHS